MIHLLCGGAARPPLLPAAAGAALSDAPEMHCFLFKLACVCLCVTD